MTDLTTVLRDLSEKAAKATADPDITPVYPPLCPPALIQALVEVSLAGMAWRHALANVGVAASGGAMTVILRGVQAEANQRQVEFWDALRRLEAVAQHLNP